MNAAVLADRPATAFSAEFIPSIATTKSVASSALRSIQFMGDQGIAYVSSLARYVLTKDTAVTDKANISELTSQVLASELVKKGMPVAGLSEILGVERKTVYSWIDDGCDAKQVNHARLKLVHLLLVGEQEGALRFYHRFWNRDLGELGSLKSLLVAENIVEPAVKTALDALRPAVERAVAANEGRKAGAAVSSSPAASLTLLLQATS